MTSFFHMWQIMKLYLNFCVRFTISVCRCCVSLVEKPLLQNFICRGSKVQFIVCKMY